MQQEMLFFIADISGYTAFMIKNAVEETHGTLIINRLIKALVKEVEIPMEISKLEGDAIFLFLRKEKIPGAMVDNPELLTAALLRFFAVFSEKLSELACSTECTCGACAGIDQLKLKIVAHYGRASLDQIGQFMELSGVDVILVHRLLKNGVKERCYLMATDAALNHLRLPSDGRQYQGVERDKDIGEIPVTVYCPPSMEEPPAKREATKFEKLKSRFKMKIGSALLSRGIAKQPEFHNFPTLATHGQQEKE